jgi:hypothetical protein
MRCRATGEYGFEVFFFDVCSITGNSPRVLPSGKPGAVHTAIVNGHKQSQIDDLLPWNYAIKV